MTPDRTIEKLKVWSFSGMVGLFIFFGVKLVNLGEATISKLEEIKIVVAGHTIEQNFLKEENKDTKIRLRQLEISAWQTK